MDGNLLSNFGNADGITSLSKRFGLKKYLQLTDEEIIMNERMLREEKGMDPNGDYRDLPKLYNPESAEAGGAGGPTAPDVDGFDEDIDGTDDGTGDDVDDSTEQDVGADTETPPKSDNSKEKNK